MKNIPKLEFGFTLIELLFVMVIIAIMSAIAIPQFKSYRARAFDVRAEQDARNVALAEEAYYLDNEEYLSCENQDCRALPGVAALSGGVSLSVEAIGDEDAFVIRSQHPKGTGKIFQWDSRLGGFGN